MSAVAQSPETPPSAPAAAWAEGERPSMVKKQFTVAKLGDADDDLVQKLKELDADGDGAYSSDDIMRAAKMILAAEKSEEQAHKNSSRMTWITFAVGALLLLSITCNFLTTSFAMQLQKDRAIGRATGMMVTESNGGAPKPVATASIREEAPGLSGLKEASKEELELLEELRFFHDGGYHRLRVSQLHRYDGRVEVWGMPVGVVIVEDTGEVHYSPYGTPSPEFDDCWGPDGTITEVCGVSVDNEPPMILEVEGAHFEDPDDAPAPSPVSGDDADNDTSGRRLVVVGTDADDEFVHAEVSDNAEKQAEARRLSARRRGGGGSSGRSRSSSSSPRRRSGTPRRRAPGSAATSSGSSSPRRRGISGLLTSRRRSYGSSVSASSSTAASSYRRRSTNSYEDSSSRRRSSDYRSGGYSSNSYHASYGAPYYSVGADTSVCGHDDHLECDNEKCWCEETKTDWVQAIIIFFVIALFLCCSCTCFRMRVSERNDDDQPFAKS